MQTTDKREIQYRPFTTGVALEKTNGNTLQKIEEPQRTIFLASVAILKEWSFFRNAALHLSLAIRMI
jgi:hypothetical protein